MASDIAFSTWQKHKTWSVAADNLKSAISRARTIVLALGIGGAFLETLSTQVPAGLSQQLCAWGGAAFLAGIPILVQRFLTPAKTRAWVRARSASESLKSAVYMYAAKAAPYNGSSTDAEAALRNSAQKIEDAVEDLLSHAALVNLPKIEPPAISAPNEYISKRVTEQAEKYYRPKARLYAKKTNRFRIIEFVFAITATCMAAAAGIWGDQAAIGAWVAVLTTVGGAILTHVSASRYDFMVTSYLATARRLEALQDDWKQSEKIGIPSNEWSNFVRRCEDAISVENNSWMTKWVEVDKNEK